jgi:hypothetical protein
MEAPGRGIIQSGRRMMAEPLESAKAARNAAQRTLKARLARHA